MSGGEAEGGKMVPGYQGEESWPCSLVTSLWNRVNFKAPVTYTWEQLPMGVYISWEEAYVLYTPYSILMEDTAE